MCHCVCVFAGEESLMIFVDKRKLSRTSEASESNGTAVTLEALHQLAASYFIDRESTLHKLHHIQIASTAIKVKSASLWAWVTHNNGITLFANRLNGSHCYSILSMNAAIHWVIVPICLDAASLDKHNYCIFQNIAKWSWLAPSLKN